MRRLALPLVALLLAAPSASAWEATLVARPAEASLRDALLLAGALDATVPGAAIFGAPYADRLLFDGPVSVRHCPDRAGEPQPAAQCAQAEDTTGARLYVLAGGLVAQTPDGGATLSARSSAAALGGPNVTLNERAVGAALYVGGAATVRALTTSVSVRPLLPNASIEVRGDQGFRTYNGTAYTLYLTGAFNQTTLEARGAFLAGEGLDVNLTRAGLRRAEAELSVEELFTTLRALQPPERADRRAALAGAFGLFQLVPALLDGAAAARQNLTLNGEPRDAFTFLRLADGRFSYDGANWTGSGNASYMIDGEVVASRPGAPVAFPVVVPIALVAAAIAGRSLTFREPVRRRGRLAAHAIRLAGLGALVLLAASTLAPLVGFSPLLDAASLSLRSRVQLTLLLLGMVGSAYAAIGLPSESIVRSVLSWRDRPRAIVVPALAGVVATLTFVLFATPILLSFVARFVRL